MERVLLLAETRPADHKIVSWVLLLFCDNIIIWGGNVCPSAKCVDERMMFMYDKPRGASPRRDYA